MNHLPLLRTLLAALIAGGVLVIIGAVLFWRAPIPTTSGALPQQAYLWQKQWTANVRAAIAEASTTQNPLEGLCVSYAEIGPSNGGPAPAISRTVGLDWSRLAHCGKPIGFAVRVREFPGEVSVQREPFPTLRRVVEELRLAARAASLPPAEIQVDFDCPTSRLRGFASWLLALRREFPDQTFRFTALPTWLEARDFATLARTTGGYILQLHWLQKPGADGRPPTTLCDPAKCRSAVARAARLGIPFRIALPTYGYRLVLDAQGRLLAAAGEESALEAAQPPPGGSIRTLMADAPALADLVRAWHAQRPAMLQGIIWYRLPVVGERLNWSPRTLLAVMAGRRPGPKLAFQFVRPETEGPGELLLRNDGDADALMPLSVVVRCYQAPAAADAVGGFELEQSSSSLQRLVFTPHTDPGEIQRVIPAGGSLVFGWVRPDASDPAAARNFQCSGSIVPNSSTAPP